MTHTKEQKASCYVCGHDVESVTMAQKLAARRGLNESVYIGGGMVRHSYCAPGTERWINAMLSRDAATLTKRDREWLALYGAL